MPRFPIMILVVAVFMGCEHSHEAVWPELRARGSSEPFEEASYSIVLWQSRYGGMNYPRVEVRGSTRPGFSVRLPDGTILTPDQVTIERTGAVAVSGQGVTIFLTTHLMDEAEPCDRVAIVDRGRLVDIDNPAALCRSIGGDVITFETDTPDQLARHIGDSARASDGCVRVEHESGHTLVASVIDSFDGVVRAVHVGKPTLADVFVQRTGRRLDNENVNGEHA